jgi:hypothetical protein
VLASYPLEARLNAPRRKGLPIPGRWWTSGDPFEVIVRAHGLIAVCPALEAALVAPGRGGGGGSAGRATTTTRAARAPSPPQEGNNTYNTASLDALWPDGARGPMRGCAVVFAAGAELNP